MKSNKIKHSKFKNAGLLFEFLVRQITTDVLSDSDQSYALHLTKKYFKEGTELAKERYLYKTLTKQRKGNQNTAERLLDETIKVRCRLNEEKLELEKYNLVAEIKNYYNLDEFFQSRIPNYKQLASIYKVFKGNVEDQYYNPEDFVTSRNTILESMTHKQEDSYVKEIRQESKDLRLLAQRIMIKKFNEKYGDLYEEQRQLLKKFINNVSNTNNFKEYVVEEVDKLNNKIEQLIESFSGSSNEEILTIKLKEAQELLPELKRGNTVSDEQVENMMMYYQLVNELSNI